MPSPNLLSRVGVVVTLVITMSLSQALAGGFERIDRSSKGVAMAGARVASAEDPSALIYNVAALAFLDEDAPRVSVGLSLLNLGEVSYDGLPPGVGDGTRGSQDDRQQSAPHLFGAFRLSDKATVGAGIYSPFGFETDWGGTEDFSGRYVSLASELETLDLAAGIAYSVDSELSLGASLVYRTSDLSAQRRLASFDPAAGSVVDIAHLQQNSSDDGGLGFTAGVLWRPGGRWTLGASYASAIEIDYEGTARLTQIATGNAALNDLISAVLPLDEDLPFQSQIDFPATATVGLVFSVGERTTIEVDLAWTGWDIDAIDLNLPSNPELDQSVLQSFSDTLSYRIGTQYQIGEGILRFGVALEETPQPDNAVGPFYADADGLFYSVGYSRGWFDIGLARLDRDNRQTLVNVSGLNGRYAGSGWTVAVTSNF